MKKVIIIAGLIIVAAGFLLIFKHQNNLKLEPPAQVGGSQSSANIIKSTNMQITSPVFADQQPIPPKYSCDGQSINPPLEFKDVPAAAKSLALIMDDPDVPKNLLPNGLFVHWVVFNIPPATTSFSENQTPPGIQGNNGAGKPGYTGPCPPDRQHRYFFKLYALDTMLNLPKGTSKDELEAAMQGHIVEQVQLIGLYNRQKQ